MKQKLRWLVGVCGLITLLLLSLPQSAMATLTIGATSVSSNGVLTIDGVASSAYSFGPSTTTGAITIGGTAQSGNITLGSSSAANSVLIGNGSGVATIVLGAGNSSSKIGLGTATANNRLTVAGGADFSGTLGLAGTSVSAGRIINIDTTIGAAVNTTGTGALTLNFVATPPED